MPTLNDLQKKFPTIPKKKASFPKVITLSALPGEEESYGYIEKKGDRPKKITKEDYMQFRKSGSITPVTPVQQKKIISPPSPPTPPIEKKEKKTFKAYIPLPTKRENVTSSSLEPVMFYTSTERIKKLNNYEIKILNFFVKKSKVPKKKHRLLNEKKMRKENMTNTLRFNETVNNFYNLGLF